MMPSMSNTSYRKKKHTKFFFIFSSLYLPSPDSTHINPVKMLFNPNFDCDSTGANRVRNSELADALKENPWRYSQGLQRATLQGSFGQILHYSHPYKQQHKGAVYEARLNLHDFVLMGLKRSLHRSHYMLHVRPLLPSTAPHAQHHYPQGLKAAGVHLKKSQNQRLETLESLLN